MSQTIFNDINPASTSGTQLATYLNDFKAALMSGLKGPSRPTAVVTGGGWIDDSLELTPNFIWSYKVYTGAADITVYKINLATGSTSISGSDSTFDITKISADSVGPILTLIKKRIASGGQVNINDIVGAIEFKSTTNTGTNPVAARIKVISQDLVTAASVGAYAVLELVTTGQAVLTEAMRWINGNVGIGLTLPTNTLHLRGNTGFKTEKLADDALGTKVILKKSRITGTGAAQTSDLIGDLDFNAVDALSVENTTARFRTSATEAHTAIARGTQASLFVNKIGSVALTEKIRVADATTIFELLSLEAIQFASQDIATAATILALNADKTIVNFTGVTDTIVQGLSATGVSKTVLLHNGSTGRVTIANENGTATAANRFKLPRSKDIVLLADQSVELFYSSGSTRWKLKSGSGGGGGELSILTAASIADGGTITLSTLEARQIIKVTSSGTTGVLASLPFGSFTGIDPVEVLLIGEDNTASVFLPYNDVAFGCVGNFNGSSIEISKDLPAKAVWYPATQRFYVSQGA